tara:strand:- start:8151 stop:8336 length:186 start_codon:yes stop_codon:yes gene_type:complete
VALKRGLIDKLLVHIKDVFVFSTLNDLKFQTAFFLAREINMGWEGINNALEIPVGDNNPAR